MYTFVSQKIRLTTTPRAIAERSRQRVRLPRGACQNLEAREVGLPPLFRTRVFPDSIFRTNPTSLRALTAIHRVQVLSFHLNDPDGLHLLVERAVACLRMFKKACGVWPVLQADWQRSVELHVR